VHKAETKNAEPAQSNLEASEAILGPDFQHARCLWNAEVAIILDHRLEMLKKEQKEDGMKPNEYVVCLLLAYSYYHTL